MGSAIRDTITWVWLALVLATCLSWWLGIDHGTTDRATATTIIMSVAFVKVRWVGMYFMGLRDAPIALRLAFEGYVLVVYGAVVGVYLLG